MIEAKLGAHIRYLERTMVIKTITRTLLAISIIFALPGYAQLPEFSPIVEKAGKAVVNISTHREEPQKLVPDDLRAQLESTPLMDILRELYGNKIDEKLSGEISGIGSGSIISPNGYIVTNFHVVRDADEIYVSLNDHRQFLATLVGSDVGSDLALLKIDADNLPTVEFAEDNSAKVGQWVLAIGSPFGFENTVTAGIVSAKGRSLQSERYVPFLQTDVAINPGNSGGPLFNLQGQMIGINSQIMTESGSFAGISFAIPVHVVKSVVEQIKAKGNVTRGWMGLAFQDVTRELAKSFELKSVKGALISLVVPGSPAQKAGLKIGDIIVGFNGSKVIRATDLPPLVGVLPVHSKVPVSVVRDNKAVNLSLVLGDVTERMQVQSIQYKGTNMPTSIHEKAIKVRGLELHEKKAIASNEGVMVVNVMSKRWKDAGIRNGDIILVVDNEAIDSKNEFYELLKAQSGEIVPLLITRIGEVQRFMAVKVD
jgi:serine protease Do